MTHLSQWSGGLATWTAGKTAYLSVAFTWRLPDAYQRAVFYKAQGYHVQVGGPALFTRKGFFAGVAEEGAEYPDALARHNPHATIASRGCPVGCTFCIVPKLKGKTFTFLPDFPVRPILCDNNLSALPVQYQDYIIRKYQQTQTPLLDANSGFEPLTFDEACYRRWKVINRGPWRFAYDELREEKEVLRVFHMLRAEPPHKKQVYVLIGNEPVAACLERLHQVILGGGEPYAQPYISLNALERAPRIHHDWTPHLLTDVSRWTNRRYWKYAPFAQYLRSAPRAQTEQTSLWDEAHL